MTLSTDFLLRLTNIQINLGNFPREHEKIKQITETLIIPAMASLSSMQNKIKNEREIAFLLSSLFVYIIYIDVNDQTELSLKKHALSLGTATILLKTIHRKFKSLFHVKKLMRIITEYNDHLMSGIPATNTTIANWISNFKNSRTYLQV